MITSQKNSFVFCFLFFFKLNRIYQINNLILDIYSNIAGRKLESAGSFAILLIKIQGVGGEKKAFL